MLYYIPQVVFIQYLLTVLTVEIDPACYRTDHDLNCVLDLHLKRSELDVYRTELGCCPHRFLAVQLVELTDVAPGRSFTVHVHVVLMESVSDTFEEVWHVIHCHYLFAINQKRWLVQVGEIT